MFAIVGLGNPGSRYASSRHNAGFRAVRHLAPADAKWQHKSGCEFTSAVIERQRCLLLLPEKFMNLSGQAAVPLLHYFDVAPQETIVIHDDLDLEPGVLRLRRGGSAAGHRGLLDIIEKLGRDDFLRVRVGIGHPRRCAGEREMNRLPADDEGAVVSWVLGNPEGRDKERIEAAEFQAAQAIRCLLNEGLERAQQQFNRSLPEEQEGKDAGSTGIKD